MNKTCSITTNLHKSIIFFILNLSLTHSEHQGFTVVNDGVSRSKTHIPPTAGGGGASDTVLCRPPSLLESLRHHSRHPPQQANGISKLVQEAQKSVGWFYDESDSGVRDDKKSNYARRSLFNQVLYKRKLYELCLFSISIPL